MDINIYILVSIPYGKGKEKKYDVLSLQSNVSIPYGKGKEIKNIFHKKEKKVSIPYGKGKADPVYDPYSSASRINSLWER